MSFWKKLFGRSTAAPASKPAAPAKTSEDTALESVLEAAGYNKPIKLPTDEDSIVDSLVNSTMVRKKCLEEGLFETGEKNPQQILCSDDECPCTDQAPLIIGKTAYLYIPSVALSVSHQAA